MTAFQAVNNAARYERQIQGKQAKLLGEYFENCITRALEDYKARGEAFIEKTPEPMRPLQSLGRGMFKACFTKCAQPDFKGTLKGGRAIVFEAKHTDDDKITASRLTDEQVEALELHSQLGAITFVLVGIGFNDVYRVPWDIWKNMKDIYGHKHMKQSELEEFRVTWERGFIDLLRGIT